MADKNDMVMHYSIKIQQALEELFNEESSFCIDKDDFLKEENGTAFLHALSNRVPMHFYISITGDDEIDPLGFNHIANRLCVQFSNGIIEE